MRIKRRALSIEMTGKLNITLFLFTGILIRKAYLQLRKINQTATEIPDGIADPVIVNEWIK